MTTVAQLTVAIAGSGLVLWQIGVWCYVIVAIVAASLTTGFFVVDDIQTRLLIRRLHRNSERIESPEGWPDPPWMLFSLLVGIALGVLWPLLGAIVVWKLSIDRWRRGGDLA